MRHDGREHGRGGFTLIELMVVIIIMMILAGLLYSAIFAYQEDAKVAKTRALLAKVEGALNLYKNHHGGGVDFPFWAGTWTDGDWTKIRNANNQLLYQLLYVDNDYLKGDHALHYNENETSAPKKAQMDIIEVSGDKVIVDFWRKPIIYLFKLPDGSRPGGAPDAYAGFKNQFELYSAGLDQDFDDLRDTEDSDVDADNISASQIKPPTE